MKKLLFIPLVASLGLAECYTMQNAIDDFNIPKVKKLTLAHCKSVSLFSSQVESCLDKQFNALLDAGRTCPTEEEPIKALNEIITYDRKGEQVSIDFTMFNLWYNYLLTVSL